MSAFMVNNETLSILANFIVRYSTRYDIDDAEMMFHKLAELNVESLRQRYRDYEDMVGDIEYLPDCDIWKPYVWGQTHRIFVIEAWHYQILKSLDCYLYQSCEGNCEESKFYKFVHDIRDKWVDFIVTHQVGYSLAKWE